MTGPNISIDSVLIVDDDPILRELAAKFFEARGSSQIAAAADGREALDRLSDCGNAFDFILCDLEMPELDGVQFLRRLKQCDYCGSLAILSGMEASIVSTSESIAKSYGLRCIGSLQKPFNDAVLDCLIGGARLRALEDPPTPAPTVTHDDLEAALRRGELVPFYQPKMNVETQKTTGVEALLRWLHPEHGVIEPNVFIPMAEQSGLIRDLTDSVIQRAIEDTFRWQWKGIDANVSINFSPSLLSRLGLPDDIAGRLDAAGLRRSRFTFEVTESMVLANDAETREVLTRVRLLEFKLSIDDFGTGYSNIDSLRAFPFTELKIDKSFVQNATYDDFARACVESSVRLAKNLDLSVVAEGVETQEHYDAVTALGVDEIQGHFVADPMPADVFLNWSREPEVECVFI